MPKSDSLTETLELGLWAGTLLLQHGAEAWRVEDTVSRMMRALGAAEADVVATVTSLMASVSDGEHAQTRVRRVLAAGLNLALVDAVNALSRRTVRDGLTAEQVRRTLTRIEDSAPLYRTRALVVAAMLMAVGVVLGFGGGAREALVALPGAALLAAVRAGLARAQLPALAATVVAAWVGCVIAALLLKEVRVTHPDVVFYATIAPLLPGAAIVNAIGDLMGGHLISGLARGAAAALAAAAIAAGVVAALRLTGTFL